MRQFERSRSVRKVFRRTPGGKVHVVGIPRHVEKTVCELCGAEIASIRGNSRVFGGILCSRCVGRIVGLYARLLEGMIDMEDIDIRQRKYVKALTKLK